MSPPGRPKATLRSAQHEGTPESANAGSTLRFAEKRELILDGAAALFNRRGIKAGTLAEVAASVGLATNSLTYYYRKKEDLVVACLLRSIAALDGVIAEADARMPPGDLAGRVRVLVQGYVAMLAAIEDRLRPTLIYFTDMRALPQPQAEPAFQAYLAMFRRLRGLLHVGKAGAGVALPPWRSTERRALNARGHVLLSQLLWARTWLGHYETSDYPRVAAAVADVLLRGLAAPGQSWPAQPLPIPPLPSTELVDSRTEGRADGEAEADTSTRDAYLRTATRLINDQGVGGASVERIAAALALTKGSFYHHHDTKHELIDDCFERSFTLIRRVQWAALGQGAAGTSGWSTLLAATLPLLALHTAPQGPLLRLTAWTELPGALRWQKYTTMNRLGERYAAMVVAGQADGSLRLVDPAVASQLISGLLNCLAEVEHWLPGDTPPDLQTLLARPLLLGLLAPSAA